MNEHESMSLEQNPTEDFVSPQDDLKLEQSEGSHSGREEVEDHQLEDSTNDSGKEQTEKNDQKEVYTAQFDLFKRLFEERSDFESKLELAIDFMETSLGQGGTPHFRSFWEARRLCLPLFKENINSQQRSQLWTKYSELSKEARRLKEMLDEQSTFAVEQIEIAIQALENDISQFDENLQKAIFKESIPFPVALKGQVETYHQLQKQLDILNTQAARINALRKELLKTEMRVRHKNKFFQRLSSAGDLVFPKRKELIKQISHQFTEDVDQFIKEHFGEQASKESLFNLREEIKSLQGLAKVLTLNTHSFTNTRTRLSECWDLIKNEERERKKERAQQRVVQKQNYDTIEKQISSLKEILEKQEESSSESLKKIDGITTQMRKVELGREDLKILRDNLNEARKIINDQMKSEVKARQNQENERELQKKEKYKILKEQTEHLLQTYDPLEADQLISQRDTLLAQIHDSSLTKNEKQELERMLKPLRDIINEKQEKAIMAMPESDRQALQQMKTILSQRKDRRLEIKNQLEQLRKTAGSSHLDFEKAMSCNAQINEEKERLEKINQAIKEIEQKIVELQAKIRSS